MAEHILVVEDDPDVRSFVEMYLRKQGYEVSAASDGEGMRWHLDEKPVDLVILDLGLPGEDGVILAGRIRGESDIPIIMLTGRDDTVDRVVGLEVGADDYVTKPFEARELLARIRSVLRRSAKTKEPEQKPGVAGTTANFEGWQLDSSRRQLVSRQGDIVRLTAAEFDLLAVFASNPGIVLSRERLLDLARGREAFPFDRSIDVHVSRLRRSIEPDPKDPVLIKTVRAAGYVFTPNVKWS